MELKEFLSIIAVKKIVIFGTGSASRQIGSLIPYNVTYYVDNDSNKWDLEFLNSRIFPPEVLTKEDPDNLAIIIMSMFYPEIANQLKKLGFSEEKHFWNGLDLLPDDQTTILNEVTLEYPVESSPRYGYGKPAHQKIQAIINRERKRYQGILKKFARYQSFFDNIPLFAMEFNSPEPYWNNEFIPGLDAISIYAFLALNNPDRYFEIGSGNSTKFARRAIKEQGLRTKITSFDPFPRREVDGLCDRIIREPLEKVDLTVFAELQKGDILFVDNSHRSSMNTDVTVVFLDILPYLKKGVLVGFHDIFLPYDYPPDWAKRFYSEQYLLASAILAQGKKFRIELANHFITKDLELKQLLIPIWDKSREALLGGAAFWIKTL